MFCVMLEKLGPKRHRVVSKIRASKLVKSQTSIDITLPIF